MPNDASMSYWRYKRRGADRSRRPKRLHFALIFLRSGERTLIFGSRVLISI